MKPHLIMPMGGAGSRFYKNGYMLPKPLIDIHDKPFLFWASMSIMKYIDVADVTFVVLRQHIDNYDIDKIILHYFPQARIVILPEILPGPVYTSIKGIELIHDEAPIIFNDCDHMFKCSEINSLFTNDEFKYDGGLLTFESSEPQYSYVQYEAGKIVGTIEKKVVSNRAICGAYIFENAKLFKKMAEIYINHCPYNECYMSGLYNVMCEKNMEIKDFLLDYHVEFGTPEEYEKAKESPYFSELV